MKLINSEQEAFNIRVASARKILKKKSDEAIKRGHAFSGFLGVRSDRWYFKILIFSSASPS